MKSIGNRLKQVRSERKKSQKELAVILGIPFRTLQDCEQGKTMPSATTLAAYSTIEVDMNWVITGRKDHVNNPAKHIELAAAKNKNIVNDELIPIPWFAADDVRKSYLVDEEIRYSTAKIALHKSEFSRLGCRQKNKPADHFELASTTIPCSDTNGLNEICGLVLFDFLDSELNNPSYFICVENGLLVTKRLQRLSNGVLIRFGHREAAPVTVEPKSTRLIGRVVANF